MKNLQWIASLAMVLACTASTQAALFDLETKLIAVDAATGDRFGYSVAISGNTAIVGAYGDDDVISFSGSAYLFDVTTGNQIAKLTATDAAPLEFFGRSVAISGNTAIVGAPGYRDSGSVYVFDVTTGNQLAKLTVSETKAFGYSVAISGNTAIVGAFGEDNYSPRPPHFLFGDHDSGSHSGSAYLFDISTGSQIAKLTAEDATGTDQFGGHVAISGNTAIVGRLFDDHAGGASGSAYLFDASTGKQLAKLTASDAAASALFGRSVAISGNTAIVGARGDHVGGIASGSAYVFDVTSGKQLAKLTPSDGAKSDLFGHSVAISGNSAIVGANWKDDAGLYSGTAYLFDVATGNQLAKLTAPDAAAFDLFGGSVAISGNTAIVGALGNQDAGAAYLFENIIPEPSTLLLGVMACLGLLRQRNC